MDFVQITKFWQLVELSSDVEIQDLKVSWGLKILYFLYDILYIQSFLYMIYYIYNPRGWPKRSQVHLLRKECIVHREPLIRAMPERNHFFSGIMSLRSSWCTFLVDWAPWKLHAVDGRKKVPEIAFIFLHSSLTAQNWVVNSDLTAPLSHLDCHDIHHPHPISKFATHPRSALPWELEEKFH